jgi:hypothetical protein
MPPNTWPMPTIGPIMPRKLPLPTVQLIRSVRAVAKLLDAPVVGLEERTDRIRRHAASTCYVAAHRLEELALLVEEIAPLVDPRQKGAAR